MKVSEMWGGFIAALKANDIAIEADEPVKRADEQPAPSAEDTTVLKAQMEEQKQANAALQARIATMEADARTVRLTALAGGWHGDTAAHLAILAALEEGTPAFQAYVTQQGAIAETLRQSKVFDTIGSDRAESSDIWSLVESRAQAIVKANPGTTIQQARVQVMESDPALYARYEQERRNG